MQVVFSNDSNPPSNAVKEVSNQSNDFNQGFGGKFVYITPTYTEEAHKAIGGLAVLISPGARSGLNDLAVGSGGDFR